MTENMSDLLKQLYNCISGNWWEVERDHPKTCGKFMGIGKGLET